MYYQLTVYTSDSAVDTVAYFLEDLGSNVAIYNTNDIIDIKDTKKIKDNKELYAKDIFKKRVPKCVAFFDDKQIKDVIKSLKSKLEDLKQYHVGDTGSLRIITKQAPDVDNWQNKWKEFYSRIPINDITIVPVWLAKEEDYTNGTSIIISPQQAFGTGEHATTKMVLELLQEIDVKDKEILDLGCGSAILGIGALKRGATKATLLDISTQAIENAKYNCDINFNQSKDIIYIDGTIDLIDSNKTFDVILANIAANELINMKDDINKHLKDNGYLILSGIIDFKKDNVIKNYNLTGLQLVKEASSGEWASLVYKK